jgi:hypothetical protein
MGGGNQPNQLTNVLVMRGLSWAECPLSLSVRGGGRITYFEECSTRGLEVLIDSLEDWGEKKKQGAGFCFVDRVSFSIVRHTYKHFSKTSKESYT